MEAQHPDEFIHPLIDLAPSIGVEGVAGSNPVDPMFFFKKYSQENDLKIRKLLRRRFPG